MKKVRIVEGKEKEVVKVVRLVGEGEGDEVGNRLFEGGWGWIGK